MPRKQPTAPTTVGARLRAARQKAGLTQAQLAERCEIHTQSVSDLERDKFEPSLPTLRRIGAVLGVSLAELVADQT